MSEGFDRVIWMLTLTLLAGAARAAAQTPAPAPPPPPPPAMSGNAGLGFALNRGKHRDDQPQRDVRGDARSEDA